MVFWVAVWMAKKGGKNLVISMKQPPKPFLAPISSLRNGLSQQPVFSSSLFERILEYQSASQQNGKTNRNTPPKKGGSFEHNVPLQFTGP